MKTAEKESKAAEMIQQKWRKQAEEAATHEAIDKARLEAAEEEV